MQFERSARMDLTTSTEGDPTEYADPVVVTKPESEPPESQPCPAADGDLTSTGGRSRWRSRNGRETSNLNVQVGLWPPRMNIALNVEGPLSWAAPLCAVLGLAVLPVIFVANVRLAEMTCASILLVGTGVLLLLVHRGKRGDDR